VADTVSDLAQTAAMPSRKPIRRRFVRYALGSGVATAVSAVAFALAYRVLHAPPWLASGTAFVSGALVNFTANRFWAWGRRQRLGLGRDALSYAVLAIGTALAAAGVTSATAWLVGDADPTRRAILVEGGYFATYAAMFMVKFMLLDRVVFRSRHQAPKPTRA
jgi:putative flippase GtrA